MTYRVLIVEDMKIIREGISELLADFGTFELFEASNGFEAVEIINLKKIDFMLVDIRMPYCSGLELLEILQEKKLLIPAIIISGFDDFHYAQKAMSYGVVGYLLKPIEETQFHREVAKIVKQLDEERQNQKKLASYEIVQKNWQTKERERALLSKLFSEEKRYEKSKFYTVSLLKIYSSDSFSAEKAKQLWEQNINEYFPLIVAHPVLKDTYLFIFENDADYYTEICLAVQKVIESLTNLLDITFAMSVSQTNHFLCREVYEQVETTLYQRFFYEEPQLYFYQNYSNEGALTVKGNMGMLKKYLALNEWTKVKEMLDILLTYPSSQPNPKKYFFSAHDNYSRIRNGNVRRGCFKAIVAAKS